MLSMLPMRRPVITAFASPARSSWLALILSLVLAASVRAAPTVETAALDPTTQRILALEEEGRAKPAESAAALEALLPATAPSSAQRIELLTVQGLMLATSFQADAAERAAAQLEAWSDPRTAAAASASALLIRAQATARGGNLKRADASMQESIARLPANLPARERYRFVTVRAYIRNEAGKFEDAIRLYHEALVLADQQGLAWRRADVRSNLAYSYVLAHQLERAHTLTQEAIEIAEGARDWEALGRAHITMGIVLDEQGDREGQRRSFVLAIEYARRAGAKRDEVNYLANLSDFYLKNAEYKTALAQAERALPLARALSDKNSEMVALANIGLAQVSLQQFEIGKRFVAEAIAIEDGRGSVSGVSDLWHELGVYLERAGDLPGAIDAYQRHRRLATTLLRGDEQKAILAMQEQYDADGRARALALLNRESALKAEQLKRGDLQQRLWGLLALSFVLLFAVLALLYRRVRKTNRLLSTTNERLRRQSERDPLTGLANRRHFQTAMRRLAEDERLAGTFYLIDIDHFKVINDRHGHAAGDAVLVEVARRLRETLRDEDLIVRWGGEEFLVVVQALVPEQVDALAQRLLDAFDHLPVQIGASRIPLSASIGFATFPIGPAALAVSWERALNLVDTAMYLAKAHGRNRAHGVRVLQPLDATELEAVAHALEDAWRDGRVALTVLEGRPVFAPKVQAVAA